jgi:hypothetical protein
MRSTPSPVAGQTAACWLDVQLVAARAEGGRNSPAGETHQYGQRLIKNHAATLRVESRWMLFCVRGNAGSPRPREFRIALLLPAVGAQA